MKCTRCKRLVLHPAKVVPVNGGQEVWGRICAIKAGLLTPRSRGLFSPAIKQPDPDPLQMKLEFS